MKAFQVISTTALFLFLGATLPAFAQEEHHEEAAKPAKQQEQAKPAKQEEQRQVKGQEQQQKQQEQAKSSRQEEQKQAKGQQEQQQKQQEQAKSSRQEEQKQAKGQQEQQQKQQEQAKSSRQEEQKQAKGQQEQQQKQQEQAKSSRQEQQHEQQVKGQQEQQQKQTGSERAARRPFNQSKSSTDRKANSAQRGRTTARTTGSPNTAIGVNAAATTVTGFPRIVIAATSVRNTRFAFTPIPWRSSVEIRDFSMAVSGSVRWTRGRNTGRQIGTTTTTCISLTPTTGITSTTAAIRKIGLRSPCTQTSGS
jgi:hypothetical protein